MQKRENAFIVISKKDYYLYVYEQQGASGAVLLARYDCAIGLAPGNKTQPGDLRTPHSPPEQPFTISEIAASADWKHDFGDGRGKIPAYGKYFLRLDVPGYNSIGIHGSTNNRETVPGRASEGCIRLRDEDIIDLRETYAFEGMRVIIKDDDAGDLPFEIAAMQGQNITRKRGAAITATKLKAVTRNKIAKKTKGTKKKTARKSSPAKARKAGKGNTGKKKPAAKARKKGGKK